jgi:hypothetical protein
MSAMSGLCPDSVRVREAKCLSESRRNPRFVRVVSDSRAIFAKGFPELPGDFGTLAHGTPCSRHKETILKCILYTLTTLTSLEDIDKYKGFSRQGKI